MFFVLLLFCWFVRELKKERSPISTNKSFHQTHYHHIKHEKAAQTSKAFYFIISLRWDVVFVSFRFLCFFFFISHLSTNFKVFETIYNKTNYCFFFFHSIVQMREKHKYSRCKAALQKKKRKKWLNVLCRLI